MRYVLHAKCIQLQGCVLECMVQECVWECLARNNLWSNVAADALGAVFLNNVHPFPLRWLSSWQEHHSIQFWSYNTEMLGMLQTWLHLLVNFKPTSFHSWVGNGTNSQGIKLWMNECIRLAVIMHVVLYLKLHIHGINNRFVLFSLLEQNPHKFVYIFGLSAWDV